MRKKTARSTLRPGRFKGPCWPFSQESSRTIVGGRRPLRSSSRCPASSTAGCTAAPAGHGLGASGAVGRVGRARASSGGPGGFRMPLAGVGRDGGPGGGLGPLRGAAGSGRLVAPAAGRGWQTCQRCRRINVVGWVVVVGPKRSTLWALGKSAFTVRQPEPWLSSGRHNSAAASWETPDFSQPRLNSFLIYFFILTLHFISLFFSHHKPAAPLRWTAV